jgi:hypothetical protein
MAPMLAWMIEAEGIDPCRSWIGRSASDDTFSVRQMGI